MQSPGAGPSSTAPRATTPEAETQATAPIHPLPPTHFYSIEYPGYVRPASVPLALERLGGQPAIDTAFRRATGRDRVESLLELGFRPGNPYAHPIPGEVVPTSNVVLRVVKRRRKHKDGYTGDGAVGEYTTEAVGVVPKTARFRSMCATMYC